MKARVTLRHFFPIFTRTKFGTMLFIHSKRHNALSHEQTPLGQSSKGKTHLTGKHLLQGGIHPRKDDGRAQYNTITI